METWLRLYQTINIKNYTTYRHDRLDGHRGGGVAILVDYNIVSSYDGNFKYYLNGLMESLVVNLNFNGVNSNVYLLYIPVEEFDFYFSGLGKNSLLLVDYNAHHNSWEETSLRSMVNSTGKIIFTSYTSHNFLLLPPYNLGTYYDIHSIRNSTINLVLVLVNFT